MIKKFNILQYKGYDEFKCIGDKCKYTCCSGWQINVDDNTFRKYKRNSYFSKKIMKDNFIIKKGEEVQIKLDENKNCKFLTCEGLCDIHRKLGETFLGKICKVYPRGTNIVNGQIEKHIYTSCPAMVELFLMQDEPISFDSLTKIEKIEDMSIKMKVDIDEKTYMKYFWEIRIFSISLLQNRQFDIEKRLLMLGMFCKKIDGLSEKEIDKIPIIITQYSELIQNPENFKSIDDLGVDIQKKCEIIGKLVVKNLNANLVDKMIDIDELLGGFETYKILEENKFAKFKNEYEYMFENYLVNIAYSSCMPYSRRKSILASFIGLAIQYAMIKLYLIALKEESLSTESFSTVVSLASRSLNHNLYTLEDVIIDAIDEDTGLLGLIMTLIK